MGESRLLWHGCTLSLCLGLVWMGACSSGSSPRSGVGGFGGGAGVGGGAGGSGGVAKPCPCPSGEVCVQEQCLPGQGTCESDDDCGGDTYCCGAGCLSDPGDSPTCIAYGSGPRGDVNELCLGDITIGLFQADVQCEWTGPPPGDPFPDHVQVLTTPLVADLPFDSGVAKEIVIVTYNGLDGGSPAAEGTDPARFGVIRILNGQTCEQIVNLDDPANRVIAASPPAIGDINGDGFPDIVTHRALGGVIAYAWNEPAETYTGLWVALSTNISGQRWDGLALHDLDDDGIPEVISASEVYDGPTGNRLNPGQVLPAAGAMSVPAVADVDGDGEIEITARDIHRWNAGTNQWDLAYPLGHSAQFWAVADFGTPGATPAEFDANSFDGIAEIVSTGNGNARLMTLSGQVLLNVSSGILGGGPPTIGDFDDDGRPEFASAGGNSYRLFDLDCTTDPACLTTEIRWSTSSQDLSSNRTGSSIFDFEGDGAAEAVYGDECFTRIYEGSTGEVLYSAFRTSCTWFENPVIADPDGDSNTEILIGSNANCDRTCPAIDPIHRGNRCETAADCLSGLCDVGFCRCADDSECREGYSCEAPIAGTPGSGDTCRAEHPPGVGQVGLRVLRDALDRWVSSRPMWNQHTYSVTNVNDDGTIPMTSDWVANFSDPALNNFRQNVQGEAAPGTQPDITGDVDESVCQTSGEERLLTATVCNRGTRTVGASMPATFYAGDPADENLLCVSFTEGPVPVGSCLEVSCIIDVDIQGKITMVVNDDGQGGRTTTECNDSNNSDDVTIICVQ